MRAALLAALVAATPAMADDLELILNDPIERDGPKDQCVDAHCRALLTLISNAKERIDFAVYGFRNQSEIINALIAAKERGVQLRGIVDMTPEGVNYYSSTESVMERLPGVIHTDYEADRRAKQNSRNFTGKPKCERPNGFDGPLQCLSYDLGDRCLLAAHASREEIDNSAGIMHNKFFLVDDRYLWTGSTNVSDSGTGGYNANLVTVVDSPTVAGFYRAEFDQMYVGGKYHDEKRKSGKLQHDLGNGVKVEVLFSPQDKPITNAVRPLIQNAKERIDVTIFFLTHKRIAADLIEAHQRGVKVRIILDATAAKNGYTKHELLRAAGIPVKVENWGGKMHSKAAVIDGEHIITGSMNWTSAGEGGNDENTIIVHSKTHGKEFEAYFDRIWKAIPDKWLKGRPDPESMESVASCFDDVDNDYDHEPDASDPGCSANPPPLPALPPYQLVEKRDGQGLIKGVIDPAGGKTYHTKFSPFYEDIAVNPDTGGQWFCSEADAKESGFRRGG